VPPAPGGIFPSSSGPRHPQPQVRSYARGQAPRAGREDELPPARAGDGVSRLNTAPAAPRARASEASPLPHRPIPTLRACPRAIVCLGNAGAGRPYPSRSEADFAVCLAMFGAHYGEAEVWAIMTDPSNGISDRTLEKRPHAESYLELTIGKARRVARRQPSASSSSSRSSNQRLSRSSTRSL